MAAIKTYAEYQAMHAVHGNNGGGHSADAAGNNNGTPQMLNSALIQHTPPSTAVIQQNPVNYETISVIKSSPHIIANRSVIINQQQLNPVVNQNGGRSAIVGINNDGTVEFATTPGSGSGGGNMNDIFNGGGGGGHGQNGVHRQQQAVIVGDTLQVGGVPSSSNINGAKVDLVNLMAPVASGGEGSSTSLQQQSTSRNTDGLISYQVVNVPGGSDIKKFNFVDEKMTMSQEEQISNKNTAPQNVEASIFDEFLPQQEGKESHASLELEVVHSSVSNVLLRNTEDGTLHKAEVMKTTVSANGHVVKTVKGNIIGVVTIVDDQADVELERKTIREKRNRPANSSIIQQAPSNIVTMSSNSNATNSPNINAPATATKSSPFVVEATVPVHEVQSNDLLAGHSMTTIHVPVSTIQVVPNRPRQLPDTPPPDNLYNPSAEDLTKSSEKSEKKKAPAKKQGKKRSAAGNDQEESGGMARDNNFKLECQVCKGEAGKHSYYGGQVCTSCRAFFRRSVISKASCTYFCVKEGDCEINFKTRKQCQFCRYKRCEEAGMKASWVLTDTKNSLGSGNGVGTAANGFGAAGNYDDPDDPLPLAEKRQRLDEDGYSFDFDPSKLIHITEGEMNFIQSLVDNWENSIQSKVNDLGTSLVKEIIRMVAFGKELPRSGFQNLVATLKCRAMKAAAKIGDLKSISAEDREQILRQNVPLLVKLSLAIMVSPGHNWEKQLVGLLGQVEIDKLRQKFITKGCKDTSRLRLQYDQLFSCLLSKDELDKEREFVKVMEDIGAWPSDEKEFILISIMILFCSNTLKLKNGREVDEYQSNIAELLQNYLNHRLGKEKGRSKFVQGIYLINKCQELHSMVNDRFPASS